MNATSHTRHRDLQPIQHIKSSSYPVFSISSGTWYGQNWLTDYPELVCRFQGQTIKIRPGKDNVFVSVKKKLAGTVQIERFLSASSLEEAAHLGLNYKWETILSAGKTWYLIDSLDGYKHWKTAFAKHDSGEIYWRGDHFTVVRRISVTGNNIEVKSGSKVSSFHDGRIRTFDQAAEFCSELISQLLSSKGM